MGTMISSGHWYPLGIIYRCPSGSIVRAMAERDLNRFLVRMPDGMRDRISVEAKANNRSMNAEIVARLEASFDEKDAKPFTFEEIAALVDEIREMRSNLKAKGP